MVSNAKTGGGNFGQGVNQHSQRDKFLNEKNEDGTRKSFASHFADRKEAGVNAGLDYMVKQEEKQNKQNEKMANGPPAALAALQQKFENAGNKQAASPPPPQNSPPA